MSCEQHQLFINKSVININFMSKKDYIVIASTIKTELAQARNNTLERQNTIKNLALCLSLSLRVDNSRFDDTKFLTACGIK